MHLTKAYGKLIILAMETSGFLKKELKKAISSLIIPLDFLQYNRLIAFYGVQFAVGLAVLENVQGSLLPSDLHKTVFFFQTLHHAPSGNFHRRYPKRPAHTFEER